jgi:hypothetical protein
MDLRGKEKEVVSYRPLLFLPNCQELHISAPFYKGVRIEDITGYAHVA